MSDHGPPQKPRRSSRGSADNYDVNEWNRLIDDALGYSSSPSGGGILVDDEAKRDYLLFKENERVRQATATELMRLCREGKFNIISEFRARRWELREWIDEIERAYWSQKDKESEQWK